jgi:hypothetical protein
VFHKQPEQPLGLATLYQNVHFRIFKNVFAAQKKVHFGC